MSVNSGLQGKGSYHRLHNGNIKLCDSSGVGQTFFYGWRTKIDFLREVTFVFWTKSNSVH